MENKGYIGRKILAKLIQSKCRTGDIKDHLVVIGQAQDLYRKATMHFPSDTSAGS